VIGEEKFRKECAQALSFGVFSLLKMKANNNKEVNIGLT
jgi:hypothetical protein